MTRVRDLERRFIQNRGWRYVGDNTWKRRGVGSVTRTEAFQYEFTQLPRGERRQLRARLVEAV